MQPPIPISPKPLSQHFGTHNFTSDPFGLGSIWQPQTAVFHANVSNNTWRCTLFYVRHPCNRTYHYSAWPPAADMPFTSPVTGEVFTQTGFARKMISEYTAAGIPALNIHPQSFNHDDVLCWLKTAPEFGNNAILLDGRKYDASNPSDTQTPTLQRIADMGITTIAPPQWVLLKNFGGQIIPLDYAQATSTSSPGRLSVRPSLSGRSGGSWQILRPINAWCLTDDADIYTTLDVLNRQVGIKGMFSDWPATVIYHASCMKP